MRALTSEEIEVLLSGNLGIGVDNLDNHTNTKTANISGSAASQSSLIELELSSNLSIPQSDSLSTNKSECQGGTAGGGICTLERLDDNSSSQTGSPAIPDLLYHNLAHPLLFYEWFLFLLHLE